MTSPNEFPLSVKYYGTTKPLPKKIELKAGNLQLIYESGNVRSIKHGQSEVIRMISSAVRDRNWGTLPHSVKDEKIEIHGNHFSISYTAVYGTPAVYKAKYTIIGTADSKIKFLMSGEIIQDFERNRIGFCVLHPIKECAGVPCTITTVNAKKEVIPFPKNISPHQPFLNIREMSWQNNEFEAKIKFTGDTFETEDQRNWTDASYKTYCTPLSLKFPVKLTKGQRLSQSVELSCKGIKQPTLTPSKKMNGLKAIFSKTNRFPSIGLLYNKKNAPLRLSEKELLKQCGVLHLRYNLKFEEIEWKKKLKHFIEDAMELKAAIELACFFTNNYKKEAKELLTLLNDVNIACLSFLSENEKSTSDMHLNHLVPIFKKLENIRHLGAGTDFDFTDLNRKPVKASNLDYVFYSISPQVHAFDNQSIIENLEVQPDTLSTAKELIPSAKVHVSTLSFKRRSNPDATGKVDIDPNELPADTDPRQMSLFGAAWTLASIKHLAENGAELVTLFETTGMKGIIMGEIENKFPQYFWAHKNDIFPVYYLIKTICDFKPKTTIKTQSSNPQEFESLLLKNKDGSLLIIANLVGENLSIELGDFKGHSKIKTLDADNFKFFTCKNPTKLSIEKNTILKVKPYSLSFIWQE